MMNENDMRNLKMGEMDEIAGGWDANDVGQCQTFIRFYKRNGKTLEELLADIPREDERDYIREMWDKIN